MTTSTPWVAVDLASLSMPDVVETLSYETILAREITAFQVALPTYTTLGLESDPVRKLLERDAYDELTLRQRINDAARQTMLAFASGTNLDHLAALVPLVRADGETDESFRARVQLAPEAFSVAGPAGAYVFWAKAASSIADVSVQRPRPGDVLVTVLSTEGDGSCATIEILKEETVVLSPSATLDAAAGATGIRVTSGSTVYGRDVDYTWAASTLTLARTAESAIAEGATVTVQRVRRGEVELAGEALNNQAVRPLNDTVIVAGAAIVPYAVVASIHTTTAGPEAELAREAAEAAVKTYVAARHKLGATVTRSGLLAALHASGVWLAEVTSPAADLVIDKGQASWCSSVVVTVGGVNGD